MDDRDSESVALFNIGDAYHLANDVERAIPYYKDALVLDMPSTNYKCALGLGVACLQMGQQQEAEKHFNTCIRILMDSPNINLSFHPQMTALGVSLLAVGKTHEGLEVYRRGLELSPLREFLYYAIQDLLLLQRVPQPIAGLGEAINMLTQHRNILAVPYGNDQLE
jgi:tetratricopeptide (TPR) repeat protein